MLEEQGSKQRMVAAEEYNWTVQQRGSDLVKTRQMIWMERKSWIIVLERQQLKEMLTQTSPTLQTRYLQNDQIDMEKNGDKGTVGREEVDGGANGVVDGKMVSEEGV